MSQYLFWRIFDLLNEMNVIYMLSHLKWVILFPIGNAFAVAVDPRGSQVHLISCNDFYNGEYLMYWMNNKWILISVLLGHENAIIVFPIGHHRLYAVVVRRWSNPSITAAARYVYFHVPLFVTANIGVLNEMHLIHMWKDIRKQLFFFL